MRVEVTIERQHREGWRQVARGKFDVDFDDPDDDSDERIPAWLKEKGVPSDMRAAVGWAVRIAIVP